MRVKSGGAFSPALLSRWGMMNGGRFSPSIAAPLWYEEEENLLPALLRSLGMFKKKF